MILEDDNKNMSNVNVMKKVIFFIGLGLWLIVLVNNMKL